MLKKINIKFKDCCHINDLPPMLIGLIMDIQLPEMLTFTNWKHTNTKNNDNFF